MTKLEQVRAALRQADIDALWVSDPTNVSYLSGFSSGEDAKILITQQSATLFTDSRYSIQAAEESEMKAFIAYPPNRLKDTMQYAYSIIDGLSVGFEAEHLTVAELQSFEQNWPNSKLVSTEGLIELIRLIKTPAEIEAIKAAAALNDEVFAQIRPMIVAGVREIDIAAAIETRFIWAGAGAAFKTIVASGKRGAMPHGVASEKRIEENELVTVDMGALLNGYNSDMTRTVAVGNPSPELRRMYNAVREAEETALAAIKAGVRAADLDALARKVLEKHGLAEAFTHSLGHGVGRQIHESPSLRSISDEVLAAGMVITIEPGVYLPEVGGIRIEDLVLVTETGYEVLSHSIKEQL